ncbi:MAG: glycosyltransferase family 2 protein [Clostridia bacterium]|nr:glycosyltransferase family 2 protein [Clostridia bacterium]
MKVSIITPSYNREKLLKNAYNSLIKQTNKAFEWIVVDDGSVDNTEKVVKELISENKIEIKYHKKPNGGKHTALNEGYDIATGELIVILDSDDILTEDAIETILTDWKEYENNSKICGLSYKRKLINGSEDKPLPTSPYISNHIECRYNEGYLADRTEVYKTEIMRRFKFPVFENERFLSEGIVWNSIGKEYDTVYIDKYIYICEYQPDGLTSNNGNLNIKNPKGSAENFKIMTKKPFKFMLRAKYSIIYNAYCNFAKIPFKERMGKENFFLVTITKPAGDIVYNVWNKKFQKDLEKYKN